MGCAFLDSGLLKQVVPVDLMVTLFAGWSDGKIRAFMPESGKEMFTQEEAHAKGVTALASYSDCRHIVSGGGEGSVRVWQIGTGE